MTIQQFKIFAQKELSSSPSPALDASVFLEHVLKQTKTQILMNAAQTLSEEEEAALLSAVGQRKTGLPVAYITGHKEFYGYDFFVTPDVLIPKPDTEILVEKALDAIIAKMEARPDIVLSLCDMCTGSGCIGISVLKQLIEEYHVPSGSLPRLTLVDISGAALEIAKKNAFRLLPPLEAEELRFIQSNLFSEIEYTLDVILTNPPYVPAALTDELLKDGRNEPRLALDGDFFPGGEENSVDGLNLIRALWPQAAEHLAHNGVILMETGEYNAESSAEIARSAGFRNLRIHRDLEGQLRVTEAVK